MQKSDWEGKVRLGEKIILEEKSETGCEHAEGGKSQVELGLSGNGCAH
jgi:hypothetical protein